MNKPISNPVLSVQNRKKTNFTIFDKTPKGPFKFEKISNGENAGFYKRVPAILKSGKPVIYTKAFFEAPIKYHFKDYLPYYDGFYYIPRSNIPIKKLIYGLQNYDMPSSGNIEVFINKFNSISIPKTFCPIIDPCIFEWCAPCEESRLAHEIELEKGNIKRKPTLENYIYLMLVIGFIALIATLALGI